MKYFAPIAIAFVCIAWCWHYEDYQPPLIITIGGLLYWFFWLLPLKEVKVHSGYLIISNDFKEDKVPFSEVEKITTGGWPSYVTRIDFKHKTKFGESISFPTITDVFFGGVNERIKNILTQIQDNKEK